VARVFDVNRTAQIIKGALLQPRATWQVYLPNVDDWRQTLKELSLPLIIGALILSFLLSLIFPGSASSFVGLGLGGVVFAIVGGILGLLISAFIFAFLAGVFKGRNDFDKAFAALSLTSVPAYAGIMIESLPLIGYLLSLLLTIYSLVLTYQIIPDALGVPQERRIVHFISCLIAGFVALFVIGLVFLQIFGPLFLSD
jgi:hypothetical protein